MFVVGGTLPVVTYTAGLHLVVIPHYYVFPISHTYFTLPPTVHVDGPIWAYLPRCYGYSLLFSFPRLFPVRPFCSRFDRFHTLHLPLMKALPTCCHYLLSRPFVVDLIVIRFGDVCYLFYDLFCYTLFYVHTRSLHFVVVTLRLPRFVVAPLLPTLPR